MDSLRISLRQWQIFVAIADAGSTSAAAGHVALSQSATSAALNDLERLLGVMLFDRIGKRLMLNDRGRDLLPQARQILDAAAALERDARDDPDGLGTLRIGASTTIGNYVLPRALAAFQHSLAPRARSRWDAHVSIANTLTIARQVASFELDLALVEGPCHETELAVETWLQDELVVVAAPADPLAGLECVPLDALRQATWLLREEGSGTRETILQTLTPSLNHLRTGIEFGNSEAIKRAAAGGLGITCLSRWVVADMLRSGELAELRTDLPPLTRDFYLIRHKHKPISPGIGLVIDFLRTFEG